MSVAVALMIAAAVAVAVAWPLLQGSGAEDRPEPGSESATLEHEKAVALMAIREADFDRATGKLSEEDHRSLRAQYEERALGAIKALDGARSAAERALATAAPAATVARYCHACGRGFSGADRFCAGCGERRSGPGADR